MNILKVIITILFTAIIPSALQGQSAELAFVYRPIDPNFWEKYQKLENDEKYDSALQFVNRYQIRVKKDSLQKTEADLAVANILVRLDLSFAATLLLVDIVKTKQGSQASFAALLLLEKIIKEFPTDEESILGSSIYEIEYGKVPFEVANFIGFHNGQLNEFNGFDVWAKQDFKSIVPQSYWDFRLKYIAALKHVKNNRLDEALLMFKELAEQVDLPKDIRNDASHQVARILFEKSQFLQSYEVLRTVELNARERGVILLERAWSKYYLKDYSKALGLLTALEAPVFDPSRTPEAYLLKMLIYKELCYYNSAVKVMSEFKKRFGPALSKIEKRQDLLKDRMLVQMATLDRRYGAKVNFLNKLRSEHKVLKSTDFAGLSNRKGLVAGYQGKMKEVKARLDYELKTHLRVAADQLLDWTEQISFLDYQVRVDMLRVVRPVDEVDFRLEKISTTQFDRIYWLFNGEYWFDEIENLKVLVESQCQKGRVVR